MRLSRHSNWLKDAGYTLEEEARIFEDQLSDIIKNPRWYLDNLDYLPTYRVSWKNYRMYKGKTTATSPWIAENRKRL